MAAIGIICGVILVAGVISGCLVVILLLLSRPPKITVKYKSRFDWVAIILSLMAMFTLYTWPEVPGWSLIPVVPVVFGISYLALAAASSYYDWMEGKANDKQEIADLKNQIEVSKEIGSKNSNG
jgi:uncharacterized membrane protein YfhO